MKPKLMISTQTYLEHNEVMTIEINNFLLDLAGIDSQLDVNGLGNYRAFLNRLDEVIITKKTAPECLEL
jgi:hypothetical protein